MLALTSQVCVHGSPCGARWVWSIAAPRVARPQVPAPCLLSCPSQHWTKLLKPSSPLPSAGSRPHRDRQTLNGHRDAQSGINSDHAFNPPTACNLQTGTQVGGRDEGRIQNHFDVHQCAMAQKEETHSPRSYLSCMRRGGKKSPSGDRQAEL